MFDSTLLLLCVKCKYHDGTGSFPGPQRPGYAAIWAEPFDAAGQVVSKAVSPAVTSVQQGSQAVTKVFSARVETHMRGKRNKAKLVVSVLQSTALSLSGTGLRCQKADSTHSVPPLWVKPC